MYIKVQVFCHKKYFLFFTNFIENWATNDLSGWSVSLSSDGRTLAGGGYVDDGFKGATWIFVFDGSTNQYLQRGAKLVGSGSNSSRQGKFFAVKNIFYYRQNIEN